ncbi:glycosyltransferase family 2 protein [Thalassovita taeanensis]|uniref:Glycosyltransferase involved in cell wall bisynthesis n=1 Tax=Thalassovita taeanensis TaxID=657014 RepID=A0A1H9KYB5_9RHOB|nr:glycosyltransferase family A protein [Thalassovita taeanensis]SER03867.1 Glycosyltransferase involved in cell wall bisynthesis [Thalassovita taeanensis]
MTLHEQISLLSQSGLFNPQWYCENYSDVPLSGLDPAVHYLKYGSRWGRNPGPDFDAVFYRDRYPDISQHQIDPLVHYLMQGQAETRFPTRAAAEIHAGIKTVRKLQAELWGGLPDLAEKNLRSLCDTPELPEQVRFEAGRHLAVWLDFKGDEDGALMALERIGGMSAQYAHSAMRLIPKSVIYARHGLVPAARRALGRIPPGDHKADRQLALANLEPDGDKLRRINTLFEARGLMPLRRRNASLPLAMGNLNTVPCLSDPNTEDMGKVSVIMPAYKASDHIETALRGVCTQSHRNLEIIVVDDASPDDTFEKIVALAKADPRIIPVQAPQNGGAYAARNRGLAIATGDFITTHDADDWSHPQKIATQLAELAVDPDLMGVLTYWARIRPPFHFTTNWRLGHALLQWSHSSFLVRRGVTDALGGWDEIRVSGDMEFIWRVEAAYGVGAVRRILPDVPLALALDDVHSLTRNPDTHVRTTYHGLRHYYRGISQYWHRIAPQGLNAEQAARKWAMLPTAIKPHAPPVTKVDVLIRADCSNPQVLDEIGHIAQNAPEKHIGISHVPDPCFTDRAYGYAIEFPDAFFNLLEQSNITIACPETQVEATQTLSL